MAFHAQLGSDNTDPITVMAELLDFLTPDAVTLIWDGLPDHRSKAMTDFLARHADRLTVVRLPGYAPDLNPVEALWSGINGVELANRYLNTAEETADAAQRGSDRLRTSRRLPGSFFEHTEVISAT